VAAWLGTCPESRATEARVLETLIRPSGESMNLVVADTRQPGCDMVELPLPAAQLRWARVLGRDQAAALAQGVIVQNAGNDTHDAPPQELSPLRDDPPPASLPLDAELLPRLSANAFGAEERATLRRDDTGLALECAAGSRPAGALLRDPHRAVLPAGADYALSFTANANAAFRLGVADDKRERRGDPLPLGTLGPGTAAQIYARPSALDAAGWRFWVIECPSTAARIVLRSIRLEARDAAGSPRRSLWIWEPAAWRDGGDALLRRLAQNGADTAFITVPLNAAQSGIGDPEALAAFINRATAQGMRIWAVAGDPRAVLPAERSRYLAIARAYADYNRSMPPAARLAGLQLDIEPYLNRGYSVDSEGWLTAYLDTIAAVRAQAGMPLDVAVPFWWGRQRYRNGWFLDRLAPLVDIVSVMNYRTGRQALLDSAEPFLAWGVQAGKTVRIGLEAGSLPDESLHVYRPEARGKLWLLQTGPVAMLALLDEARANPAGIAFAHSQSTRRTGSGATFHGNVAALQKLLPELETLWRTWPSFGGIALHGFDTR
jgi:hypothetical protein